MPNPPIRDFSEPTPDAPNARTTSDTITAPKLKLGDAIKVIGQSVQGFGLQLPRDKTLTDAANFDSF